MTDEVLAAFTLWWAEQGQQLTGLEADNAIISAFAAGWWQAVRTNLENARRG